MIQFDEINEFSLYRRFFSIKPSDLCSLDRQYPRRVAPQQRSFPFLDDQSKSVFEFLYLQSVVILQ